MEKIIKILLIMLVMVSCKTAKQPVMPTVPINYKEKIVERLVPVVNPADSLNILALLECNEQNKVVLKDLSEEKSKRMQSQFSLTNGQFNYKASSIPDIVYLPVRDSIVYREVPIPVNVPIEVNKLTAWQNIEIKAGRVLFALILAFGLYQLWQRKGALIKAGLKTLLKWK